MLQAIGISKEPTETDCQIKWKAVTSFFAILEENLMLLKTDPGAGFDISSASNQVPDLGEQHSSRSRGTMG